MEQHLIADIPVKALIIRDGKILITRDRLWELPGGRMNVGEEPEETLHREITEELGVDVRILGIQDAFVRSVSEPNPPHLTLVYRCEFVDDTPIRPDEKEIQEMRWISANDDLSMISFFPGYPEMLKRFFHKLNS